MRAKSNRQEGRKEVSPGGVEKKKVERRKGNSEQRNKEKNIERKSKGNSLAQPEELRGMQKIKKERGG